MSTAPTAQRRAPVHDGPTLEEQPVADHTAHGTISAWTTRGIYYNYKRTLLVGQMAGGTLPATTTIITLQGTIGDETGGEAACAAKTRP